MPRTRSDDDPRGHRTTARRSYRYPLVSIAVPGSASGALAALVETARGPTPMYLALVDLLAEATHAGWSPERHRAAVDALVARCPGATHAAIDAVYKRDRELSNAAEQWTALFRGSAPIAPVWPY